MCAFNSSVEFRNTKIGISPVRVSSVKVEKNKNSPSINFVCKGRKVISNKLFLGPRLVYVVNFSMPSTGYFEFHLVFAYFTDPIFRIFCCTVCLPL